MALNPQSPLQRLMERFPHAGRVEWIGLSPQAREPLVEVAWARAVAGRGLEGDRRVHGRASSKRQVTLIQAEHLEVVSRMLASEDVRPGLLRRNIVVSGINLLALKDQMFRLGDIVLEGTGLCTPCSRMEANLGAGGYNVMRGHGGITARVITGGMLHIGAPVRAGDGSGADPSSTI